MSAPATPCKIPLPLPSLPLTTLLTPHFSLPLASRLTSAAAVVVVAFV